jgi:hypothetical protein
MSLFELPVSARARAVRLALILGLDALLVGVGIALLLSYVGARDRARRGDAGPAVTATTDLRSDVEILEPTALTEDESATPAPPSAPRTDGAAKGAQTSARSAPARSRERASPAVDEAAIDDPEDDDQPPELGGETSTAVTPISDAEMEMLTRKVAGVVNSHRAQFERCSAQVAKGAGPVQGNVVIRFAIMSNGRPTEVRASENTTGSDRLAACLVSQFESWTFPEHGGSKPLAFLWPLVFKAPQ